MTLKTILFALVFSLANFAIAREATASAAFTFTCQPSQCAAIKNLLNQYVAACGGKAIYHDGTTYRMTLVFTGTYFQSQCLNVQTELGNR